MRVVRFIRSHRLWNRGEEAGFPDDQAADLIKRGIAVDPAAVVEAPAAPTEPAEPAAPTEPAEPTEPVAKAKGAKG